MQRKPRGDQRLGKFADKTGLPAEVIRHPTSKKKIRKDAKLETVRKLAEKRKK